MMRGIGIGIGIGIGGWEIDRLASLKEMMAKNVEEITLTNEECLYWYDGPLIILVEVNGSLHYGHMILPANGIEYWMLVPVTQEVALDIKDNKIALRDVLLSGEGLVAQCVVGESGDNWTAVRLPSGVSFPEEWLPEEGYCLFPGRV